MKKKICFTGIAIALSALAILFIWIQLNRIPSWVIKYDREIQTNKNGLSKITSKDGYLFAYDEKNDIFWQGEKGWTVQDVLWEDIDQDLKNELILLVWKKGRYGQAKPFWETEDEKTQSQHIFIYDWDEKNKRFDPLWMASDITVDAKNISFNKTNHNLFIEDVDGMETAWKWTTWGLELSDEVVTLVAVGDNLIHETIYNIGLKKDDFSFLYDHISKPISEADIACINQETPLVNERRLYGDYPSFGTPVQIGDAIKNTGFDVVSCGTNHSYDREMVGIDTTVETLEGLGLTVTGIQCTKEIENCPYKILERKGIKFAFLNYTDILNGRKISEDCPYAVHRLDNEERIETEISEAKKEADFVIVFAHWGTEYETMPDENQIKWTNIFLKSGVDLVIGTHPHVLQPYEMIEDDNGHKMLVYYSLGNFMSAQDQPERVIGGMAKVTFSLTKDGYRITNYGLDKTITHQEKGYYTVYLEKDYPKVLQKRHRLKNLF